MSSMVKWLFGYKSESEGTQTTQRGLPATWYRSPELYQLERRAIFSKRWILVTHKLRLQGAGNYLRITEAGFPFFLIVDRKGQIRAFHNICRHRGFPLVHENQGKSSILACKYHAWSYGLDGRLAKAPYLEDVKDFEKDQNGLLPIHVHIDKLGFVWVNLDSSQVPEISWDEQCEGVDTQQRTEGFDSLEYRFDHTWEMEGAYNWKTLADNYNECLHCKVAHPDTVGLVDVELYRVEGKAGHLQHHNKRQETGINEGKIQIASMYHFPNSCMTVSPDFFYLMRCVPVSANKCSMEYEVYRHKNATDADFNEIDGFFKRVLAEDKWLCNNTQQNLESGVYVNGEMHPNFESGPLYFQKLVKEAVMAHHIEEKKQKKEIWPAAQKAGATSTTAQELDFCSSLGAESRAIAW